MVADRVKKTRDETWEERAQEGSSSAADAGHSPPGWGYAGQRGELPDQEAVRLARNSSGGEPGPDMTLRHGPRSGDLVRQGGGHHLPAGPAVRRLHRHRRLQYGGMPSGRFPVGDGGETHAARPSSMWTHASPGPAPFRISTSRSGAGSDIAFLGAIVNYIIEQ